MHPLSSLITSSLPWDSPLLVLQLALRAHNVKLTEHEGLSEEQLKKADLGGESFRSSRLWHMDLSDDKCAPEVSAMYMVQPAGSGLDDTLFARYGSGC